MPILKPVNNVNTLFTESDKGTIASFIMPAATICATSELKCDVDLRTGKLHLKHKDQRCIKQGTALEVNWAAYRYGAAHNNLLVKKLLELNKLNELFATWMQAVPAEFIRVYYGGDACLLTEVLSIIQAAKASPAKQCYFQTGNYKLLYKLVELIRLNKLKVPANCHIFIEQHSTASISCKMFPFVSYTRGIGVPELTTFPETGKNIAYSIDIDSVATLDAKRPILAATFL